MKTGDLVRVSRKCAFADLQGKIGTVIAVGSVHVDVFLSGVSGVKHFVPASLEEINESR
jgi:hypothetical protein